MKIISYNVNGIRAAIKKGFLAWLQESNPDVLCLQEIKADKTQLDLTAFTDLGYRHQYWFSAQKKGYSGVAILSKKEPHSIEYGIGISDIDIEARNLRIDYDDFSLMSLYLPSGTNENRLGFKLSYMDIFLEYIQHLIKKIPNLIISGDYNICHQEIDIHNPKQNKNTSGFLPVEREWLTKFMKIGFIDSFRFLNKNPDHYSWWSYRANSRAQNKGWRIDYHLVNEHMKNRIKHAFILNEVKHSDHCPIGLNIFK